MWIQMIMQVYPKKYLKHYFHHQMRSVMNRNPYRTIIASFAKKKGICTQCFSKPSAKGMVQCQQCIDINKRKRTKQKGIINRVLFPWSLQLVKRKPTKGVYNENI